MRWTECEAHVREKTNGFEMLVGKPEKKGRLGRPRRRWEHSSNVYLQEVGLYGAGSIHKP